MTKERRLAIQMWEEILQARTCCIEYYKDNFCCQHSLDWHHNCWFCQYIRKDRRYHIPSRQNISPHAEACQKCPIYKYNTCSGDVCGCIGLLFIRDAAKLDAAAEIIIRLLKGEKLWIKD